MEIATVSLYIIFPSISILIKKQVKSKRERNPTMSKHSIYFRTFAGVLEILRLQEFAFDVKRGLFERMRVDPFRISF